MSNLRLKIEDDYSCYNYGKFEITPEKHQIIEGLLIGDGYLDHDSPLKSSIYLGQRIDREEFVLFIAKMLGIKSSIRYYEPKVHWKAKVKSVECRYRSSKYVFLERYEKRWYKSKKIVPEDFKITPLILLIWYLGDGSFRQNQGIVRLSTCSFSEKEINGILISQFNDLGFYCYLSLRNEIYFKKQVANKFFDFIGKCPIPCFDYKWPNKPILTQKMSVDQKDEMINLYKNEYYSISQLSRIFGFTKQAISYLLRKNLTSKELYRCKRRNYKK